jgi:hypothetical protein
MNPLSPAELEDLARTRLTVDLVTAGRAWGIGRTRVHELARAGDLPFHVVRIGVSYRVPVNTLLLSLGLTPNSSEAEPATGPATAFINDNPATAKQQRESIYMFSQASDTTDVLT